MCCNVGRENVPLIGNVEGEMSIKVTVASF